VSDKISIVDNDMIAVWVYPTRNIIHHQMKAYCYGDRFYRALTKGVEAMELHHATKWLSDNRLGGALPTEDAEWTEKNWFPRAKAAGWRHWAVVQPEKIIGQLNMSRFIKKYSQQGINARMFSDLDEALLWLDAEF
jgi:hypothetical protein